MQEGLHLVVQHRHALPREPHVGGARVERVAVDDRVDEAVLELADGAEVRGPHEAHHGVVLHEVVLHRGARQDEAAARAHATQRLVQLALHVLDAVAFVEHDQVGPRVLQQRCRLAPGLALEQREHGLVADDRHTAVLLPLAQRGDALLERLLRLAGVRAGVGAGVRVEAGVRVGLGFSGGCSALTWK